MGEELTHDEKIEALMRIGLTREQAERELAAQAGLNISDLRGPDPAPPKAA